MRIMRGAELSSTFSFSRSAAMLARTSFEFLQLLLLDLDVDRIACRSASTSLPLLFQVRLEVLLLLGEDLPLRIPAS